MSKRIYILGILLLFVAAVSSCRFNEIEPDQNSSARPLGNKIAFELGTAQSVVPQTKDFAGSQQGAKTFLCVDGNDSLYLSCSVMDNNDPVVSPLGPAVKGLPVTTQNMDEFYIAANFTQKLDPTQKLAYFPFTCVDESNKTDNVYTLDYYWPQNSLDFFAANFNPDITVDPIVANQAQQLAMTRSSVTEYNHSSISWEENLVYFGYDGEGNAYGQFAYSLPEPDLHLKADALSQPDYVFAISPDVTEEELIDSNEGVVPLRFAHCFAAVTFRLGMQFMDETGRRVKSVEIINVPSRGVCTFSTDQNGDMVFDWDADESDIESYIQQIPQISETETNVANGQVINDGEMTFMLIPHEIRPDAKIRILFDLHADSEERHEMCIEKSIINLFAESAPKEWFPGKKYTYTLMSEEVVDIQVSDSFTSNEPKIMGDLDIKNTGVAPVYVRAYVIGWWENEDGDVVHPWVKDDGEWTGTQWPGGEFDPEAGNWKLGDDGFFYYTRPLMPGDSADRLFETYTLIQTTPPVMGASLCLNVVTQAIVHYKASAAWPGAGNVGFTWVNQF